MERSQNTNHQWSKSKKHYEKCPFPFGILRVAKPSGSKTEKWQNKRNSIFLKRKKCCPTPANIEDEEKKTREPFTSYLYVWVKVGLPPFPCFPRKKAVSKLYSQIDFAAEMSFILFHRKIILFSYNPIWKQRIFSHWTELLEPWSSGSVERSASFDNCIFLYSGSEWKGLLKL